jgi:hypothetical protein
MVIAQPRCSRRDSRYPAEPATGSAPISHSTTWRRWRLSRGDYTGAAALFEEGITLSDQTRDLANLAYFLEGLAVATGKRGEARRSACLFGLAEGLLKEVGATVYNYYLPDRALYDHTRAAVLSELGEEAFEEARNEGREMAFDEAVAYALGGDAASRV